METIIDRIEKLLLGAGVPPRRVRRELADTCGITVQAVGDWFKGATKKISPEYLALIAKKWNTSTDYLITGKCNNADSDNVSFKGYKETNKVPLISWVTAGNWEDPIDNYAVGYAEDWLPCPPNCKEKTTFALNITGDSMDDGTSSGYRDGEIIFVDGSKSEPAHNSDVVVKNGGGKVTFKRLINSNGTWYLKPLNPDWPDKIIELDSNCHIVGRVMFSGMRR